ncbi:hypothetical protein ACS0TY_017493 [Phlomoides rotata]
MRIQVELDVDLPLKKGQKIRFGNDSQSLVNFKYERLQIFCFICGKLGHSESYCDVKYDANGAEIKRDWGLELKAADQRFLKKIEDRWSRSGAWNNQDSALLVTGSTPREMHILESP